MLAALQIENLALVEHLELELGPGLNVLSGETGAGKSVLVAALGLVLGGRGNVDIIRNGALEAVVEAMLEVPEGAPLLQRLRARGLEVEAGEVIVRRSIGRAGRSRATINGQMVTVSMLAELMRGVVDITGQHEHVSLLDASGHLAIVDAYGGLDALALEVAAAHEEVLRHHAALDAQVMDEAEKQRREDYLRFSIEEVRTLDPRPGESETLDSERKRLRSVEELSEGVRRSEAALYSEEGAVVEVLAKVHGDLMRLSRVDERLVGLAGTAGNGLAELEELARALTRYSDGLAADPGRLEEVEERLELLKRVMRKHGGRIEDALAAKEKMERELDLLEHDEARRAELSVLLAAAKERRAALTVRLSSERHKVVRGLEAAIQGELAELSMGRTTFKVELVPEQEIRAHGAESAEIMIAPNPGEPARPLRKIASGGELSRVLLAIKHVLAVKTAAGAYVFDEIDTGIGGAVADVIGQKLKGVAQSRQVLCITHLPQVAAHADQHLLVEKRSTRDGRTTTSVRMLDERGQVEELARMLGGAGITDLTRSLARELKTDANDRRRAKARRSPDTRTPRRPARAS